MIVSSVISRPVQVSVLSNTYAANIAALKAIDISEMAGNTQISVAGYYTPGDGGGGTFYYDSGSSSTDDGGTIIAPDVGNGRWKRIYDGAVNVRWFGAKGDGTTDDTAAFKSAIGISPDGGTIELAPNSTYLVSETIVLTKPVVICGGAKGNTTVTFSSSGTYLDAPYKCGFLALHSTTVVTGYSGDASRAKLTGFTISMQSGPTSMTGVLICAPVYAYEVTVSGFSQDGFAVDASALPTANIAGNSNGSTLTNCSSIGNGRHGLYTHGTNANACIFMGVRSAQNVGWGVYEDSFLGNTYVGCETDENVAGGYGGYSVDVQNRSTYIGCYCESNQSPLWSIGKYSTRIGSQNAPGASDSYSGLGVSAIPRGDFYFSKPLIFATTDQVAEDQTGGTWVRFTKSDVQILAHASGQKLSISGILSSNYTDLVNGSVAAIRFPNSNVTGNIAIGRPYIPNGISLSGVSMLSAGTAAPTTGTYSRGAIVFNDTPTSGGFVGWVCTTGGSPGTWKTFGVIS